MNEKQGTDDKNNCLYCICQLHLFLLGPFPHEVCLNVIRNAYLKGVGSGHWSPVGSTPYL